MVALLLIFVRPDEKVHFLLFFIPPLSLINFWKILLTMQAFQIYAPPNLVNLPCVQTFKIPSLISDLIHLLFESVEIINFFKLKVLSLEQYVPPLPLLHFLNEETFRIRILPFVLLTGEHFHL